MGSGIAMNAANPLPLMCEKRVKRGPVLPYILQTYDNVSGSGVVM
jgi:hypothetical protein